MGDPAHRSLFHFIAANCTFLLTKQGYHLSSDSELRLVSAFGRSGRCPTYLLSNDHSTAT